MKLKIRGRLENQQGSIIVVVAIAMIAIVAVLAVVIDLGHLHAVRQELQNAAEAGALAGTRALFDLPGDLSTKSYPDCTRGPQTARNATALNKTDMTKDVIVLETDAQVIRWDWQLNRISPSTPSCNLEATTGVNGIRVTARRTGAVPAGAVSLTLGKIFGKDTADVEVFAVAAVASGLPPGPFNNIAINRTALETWKAMTPEQLQKLQDTSDASVIMSPDGGDNAAWCAPAPYNPNAANLKDWIKDGTSPAVQGAPDGTVNLINGNTSAFHDLKTAFNKVMSSGSSVDGGWLVYFPVVDTTKGVGSAEIVGFQAFIITEITDTTSKKGITEWHLYTGDVLPPGMSLGSQGQAYLLPKLVQLTPAKPE
jgi:Flp pilus assembly protein TadG